MFLSPTFSSSQEKCLVLYLVIISSVPLVELSALEANIFLYLNIQFALHVRDLLLPSTSVSFCSAFPMITSALNFVALL